MRIFLVIFIVTVSLIASNWEDYIENDSLRSSVMRNLSELGNSRDIYEEILIEADDEILEGVAFLIANSPASMLLGMNPDSFLIEVGLAYETRKSFPWGKDIPNELFLHYVLPNQVSQETPTFYRGYFLDELRPILDTVETGSEAAIAVNYWCGQRVRFEQTQRQDQGVFHTLASGYGRCEEMMIVYVSALRAVGIPAREAWTPYWATGDNNHAWTELWADGDWHYSGSCEPKPSLDNAWFNNTAKRAAVIMSSAFGVPQTDEELYRVRDHYAIINSMPNYIEEPSFLIVDTDSESTDVYIAVFNFGALRPIMRQNTGDSTSVSFTMGYGDFMVYAGDEHRFDWAVVNTEFGEETRVVLNPRENGNMGDEKFWLRYPAEPDRE